MKDNVESAAEPVVKALRESGFVQEANEVAGLVEAARVPETREASLEKLRAMCHVKWLGDINVSANDWWQALSALSYAAGGHPTNTSSRRANARGLS